MSIHFRSWTSITSRKFFPFLLSRLSSTTETPAVLRSRKSKSQRKNTFQKFVDRVHTRTLGGRGGDGCVSFLQLWSNPNGGPDGGDGGNGGHVLLQASKDVSDLFHVNTVIRAEEGEKGYSDDCHGRNATHTYVKVPLGTIIKNKSGVVVGDLAEHGAMFVASRGGAGGKGNHFFATDVNQAPQVAECGGEGEDNSYTLELATIADVGLIGFPNAGKSTLLQAISRARPKVAPYPFTTVQPHLGIVAYDDHKQITVADLPGLIPDSHKNKGLGIEFLKHAERCPVLLFLLDASADEPWETLTTLQEEIQHFNSSMLSRPCLIVVNKIDLPSAQQNISQLKLYIEEPIITISAKYGTNLSLLLSKIREVCDKSQKRLEDSVESGEQN